MKKLSKSFYISAIGVGFIPGIFVFALGAAESEERSEIGPPLLLLGVVLLLCVMVVMLTFWYKAWQSIQDGFARATPSMAIGYLFIPVYSFYWLFQCIWGFARDYNKYLVRHSLNARKLPEGLFLAFCLLEVVPFSAVLILVPMMGSSGEVWVGGGWIVGELAGFVLGFVLVAKTCDAVNALA